MRQILIALASVLLLAAGPAHAASPLARLAEALAEEILRVARGRAVELAGLEDRTGRALALDLRGLTLARLEGRLRLAETGRRLVVRPVLSETPARLVVSARVLEEPEGRLLDVLSVSVEHDSALLPLSPLRPPAARTTVDIVSTTRTPPVDGPVLDVAFMAEDRIVVLSSDAVTLYRWDSSGLAVESRRALPPPVTTVRAPSGILLASEPESSLWALTNRSPRALLFGLEGGRLLPRSEAEALPWPGSPGGLRYRPGTNLLEGTLPTLGAGPFLTVRSIEGDVAVTPDGQLRLAPDPAPAGSPRVGPTVAGLWRGLLAASSAQPPDRDDVLLLIAREEAGPRVVEALPVEGAVRALAGRTRGDTARLVAALERPGTGPHLLIAELRRRQP